MKANKRTADPPSIMSASRHASIARFLLHPPSSAGARRPGSALALVGPADPIRLVLEVQLEFLARVRAGGGRFCPDLDLLAGRDHVRGEALEGVGGVAGRVLDDPLEGAGVPPYPLPDARSGLAEFLDLIPDDEGVDDVARNILREMGLQPLPESTGRMAPARVNPSVRSSCCASMG